MACSFRNAALFIAVTLGCSHLSSCAWIATQLPGKQKSLTMTTKSPNQTRFLAPVSTGNYRHPASSRTRCGITKSRDPQVAATIGFARLARHRTCSSGPTQPGITDDLTMAARYFESAHLLEPSNPIHHGLCCVCIGRQYDPSKQEERNHSMVPSSGRCQPSQSSTNTVAYLMNALPLRPKTKQSRD